MSVPWNDWYHCNGNTYGTWLRGDPRGFRERRHRLEIPTELGQSAHELLDDGDRDVVGRQRPVEGGRLGAQIDAQLAFRRNHQRAATSGATRLEPEPAKQAHPHSSPPHNDTVALCYPRGP